MGIQQASIMADMQSKRVMIVKCKYEQVPGGSIMKLDDSIEEARISDTIAIEC